MHVDFGINATLYTAGRSVTRVRWTPEQSVNPHMLIMGTSGAGKTYTLRNIIRQCMATSEAQKRPPPRFHLLDTHGDLEVDDASTVTFSEQTQVGINPFAIDPDPHEGGVRKRVEAFIKALGRTKRRLGPRQEAMLRELLFQLYERKGFYPQDPASWHEGGKTPRGKPKTFPTVRELYLYINMLREQMAHYMEQNEALMLIRFRADLKKLVDYGDKLQAGKLGDTAVQNMGDLAEDLQRRFAARLQALMDGQLPREVEQIQSMDGAVKTLESMYDQISNLLGTGIFKDEAPDFDPDTAVWRYYIKPLSDDVHALFVQFQLEKLFRQARQRGVSETVRDIVIIDEAHLYMSKDGDNMINRIVREGRKFGIGLIAASQSPQHFSQDFMALVGAKVVLTTDASFWDDLYKRMRLRSRDLQFIETGRSMIVEVKKKHNQAADHERGFQFTLVTKKPLNQSAEAVSEEPDELRSMAKSQSR
jgi:hypothetical protein